METHETLDLQIWLHLATDQYFVVEPEFERCLGPFASHQVLREKRLAGGFVADGCAHGNWDYEFRLSQHAPIPFPRDHFLTVDESWYPPSLTEHVWLAEERVWINCLETRPANPPIGKDLEAPTDLAVLEELSKRTNLNGLSFALMEMGWNGHPRGSILAYQLLVPGETFWVLET
jgi:hypothetical protein